MSEKKYKLPATYSNEYYVRLWRAVRQFYLTQRETSPRFGALSLYNGHVVKVIKENSGAIIFPNEREGWREADYPNIDQKTGDKIKKYLVPKSDNRSLPKRVPRTMGKGAEEALKLTRCFDVFIHFTQPALGSTLGGNLSTATTAQVLSEYQKDQSLTHDQFALSSIIQNISGLYAYKERDSVFRESRQFRYLQIRSVDTNDYVLIFDFSWPEEGNVISLEAEHLNLYYGFAVPGRHFSPVVMRSFKWGHRQNGMLHFDNALVSLRHLPAEKFYLFSHTTEGEVVDLLSDERELATQTLDISSIGDLLAKQTLLLHQGPQTRKELIRVEDASLINRINVLLDNFKEDYL